MAGLLCKAAFLACLLAGCISAHYEDQFPILEPISAQHADDIPFLASEPVLANRTKDEGGQGSWRSASPVKEEELRSRVKATFLSKLPTIIKPIISRGSKNWVLRNNKYVHEGYTFMDINSVRPDTCKPVIRAAKSLGHGIYCTTSGGCRYQKTLTTSRTYSNSLGASISVTGEAGFNIEIFEAKVTTTYGGSYQHTWSNETGSSDEYEFSLKQGEACVPKMMHVELECELEQNVYYWDSYARWGAELRPELAKNRKGGKWTGGQYCTQAATLNDTTMTTAWQPFQPSDVGRGYGWTGESTDWHIVTGMNGLEWTTSPVKGDQLVIRRSDSDHSPNTNVLMLCDPAVRVNPTRAIVPLGTVDSFPGFIACLAD